MQYIILTVLLLLHTTLSASNVTSEEAKGSHSHLSYMGSRFFPQEIKITVLNNPNLPPEDIGCFGLTNQLNYQLVKKHYSLELTLGALRYQIKKIFRNNNSFNNAEEAIDAANLFLETYFPNENAINVFINVHLVAQGIQDSYQTFLEYVSNCFPKNENRDYFEMRNRIISTNGVFGSFCNFNNAFLPPEISTRTNLQTLYLSNDQLQIVPDGISTLTRLQDIDFINNKLKIVPEWISALTNLCFLNLNNNELEFLPNGISKLINLWGLDLRCNKLQSIPPISTLTRLQVLGLSNNQLKTVPEWIANLTNLQTLYLSNGQFQVVPDISTLTNLQYISLNNT